MIHELRIYHCMPGKIGDLNNRFANITLKLWEKHGIRQTGFWTVAIGPGNHILYYILEWKDLAERDKLWTAFSTDPEWLSKRAETEKNGPIVAHLENYILQPTSYSKIQ